jgi:hypothetical protein
MDEELEMLAEMPGETSLKVVCPACGQWMRLPENERIPAPDFPPEILREMMAQSRLVDGEDETNHSRPKKSSSKSKPWWKFW